MSTVGFVADLDAMLDKAAVTKTKQWWERYLKGDAAFRGVKMADTRRIVNDLVTGHDIAGGDAATFLKTAQHCFAQPWSEDKLAGVLLLAEHGLSTLTIDHVGDLAASLDNGHIADWNVCDWYCVKVLGRLEARRNAVTHLEGPSE